MRNECLPRRPMSQNLDLARVLLVHGDLAPRLALQTILQAGGYSVDVAASPAEARFKLDESSYELVLTENRFADDVLPYARVKGNRPATAAVSSPAIPDLLPTLSEMSVQTEDLPSLLEDVAELISARARRRYRPLRPAV
jgi:PleD family two-component response regulator